MLEDESGTLSLTELQKVLRKVYRMRGEPAPSEEEVVLLVIKWYFFSANHLFEAISC